MNLELIGTIAYTENKKAKITHPIISVFKSDETIYILDVIFGTKFKQYFAYEISKGDLTKFIQKQNNTFISPKVGCKLFKIKADDLSIIEVTSLDEKQLPLFYASNEVQDKWQCTDLESIKNFLNI